MDWMGRNKEEISGSKRSMYGYILTYFCVCSYPLGGYCGGLLAVGMWVTSTVGL